MTFKELTDNVAEESGLSKKGAESALRVIFDEVAH